MTTCNIVNDTAYHTDTPMDLIKVLESLRNSKVRVIIVYGDVKTLIPWETPFPERGTMGRSTGQYKIPLLIKTSRSLGGGAILDHCILEVRESKGKKLMYKRSI